MAAPNNNMSSAPLKKITTPGGLEWTFLMSANDEDELEIIRRENQVHYNSYSAKSEWTKFVCTRNPTAQGNCRFGLLAMDVKNKQPIMMGNARFHIYTKGSHNHQVAPIRPSTQKIPIKKANSSTANKPTQVIQKINANANNDAKQMPIKVNENKPMPPPSMKYYSPSMETGKLSSFETRGKSLTVYNICHNFNDIETLRRAEGLLVDKQFNVVDGVPEKVSYRCKIDSKCPFMLHALHNKEAGFFELYAPEVNIHVHNEPTKSATNSNLTKQNIQDLSSNSGSGGINEEIGQKCEDVKMEEINEQLNNAIGQPKGKLLQQILHSKAQHSLPVNVNLKEWNFICDIDNEGEFEQLRKTLRVVSLQQNGKLFSTVRQQTLKCYRRISKKGKCPYRILLFREGNGKSVNIYEKGKHNHFAPAIQLPSSHQSTSSSSAVQKLDNSNQIGFNIPNSINLPFMLPSSSNNESLLKRVEETIGKMNSELESTKEERQNGRMEIKQQKGNLEGIFSIFDCQMELQSLAEEFQLQFSINCGSILFKKYEMEGSFIVLSEHQKCLNIDEYRNGTFNGQTERWIKGDPLQFIYAMRARVHEFISGKHFTYGRRF